MVPPLSDGSFFATDACAGPRAATSARSRAIAAFISSFSRFALAAFSANYFFFFSSSATRRASAAAVTADASCATAAD